MRKSRTGIEHISSWSVLIIGKNINTIKENKEALLEASKVGLEVNAEKTKYIVYVSLPKSRTFII
jgi:predicted ABC-type transport system involved in lysophospholipase L1 biosynthesis ATPase subunit